MLEDLRSTGMAVELFILSEVEVTEGVKLDQDPNILTDTQVEYYKNQGLIFNKKDG